MAGMLRKDESVTEELDLEESIFDFHESGIQQRGYDADHHRRLEQNPRRTPYRTTNSKLTSRVAALWLHSQASVLFPNCEYSRRYSAGRR